MYTFVRILALPFLQASVFLPTKRSFIQHIFIEHLLCAEYSLPSKRDSVPNE